jgi:hypothetical protein
MPDFAPNFTPRYRVRYSSQGKSHRMQFRVARGVTDPTGIATKVGAFLAALEDGLYADWTVLGADFALTDSDIFLPVDPPTSPSGGVSLSGITVAAAAGSISFPGRSANGLRAVIYVYGSGFNVNVGRATDADFRMLATESSIISDAIAALNELSPAVVGNDGATATFYPYVNMKFNDHWVRKLRQG